MATILSRPQCVKIVYVALYLVWYVLVGFVFSFYGINDIDGWVQDCDISTANALEIKWRPFIARFIIANFL